MNKIGYLVLGGVVGGGLGFVVGSIIADQLYPEYEEVNLLEDDKMNTDRFTAVTERLKTIKTRKPKKGEGVVNYNQVETSKSISQLKALTKKYREEDGTTNEEVIEEVEVVDPNAPRIISAEYFDTVEGFDAITVQYYALDDVVTDSNNGVIENYENILGEEALTAFGKFPNEDPDTVYVRNTELKCDYEIIRLQESYTESVLGLKPLPTKVKKSRVFDGDD